MDKRSSKEKNGTNQGPDLAAVCLTAATVLALGFGLFYWIAKLF